MKNYSSPAPAQGKGFSPVFSGLFVVVCLGIVGSLISSLLLAFTGIREASLPYFVFGVNAVSLLIGGAFAGRKGGVKGWYYGGMTGLIYGLIILAARFLAFDLPLNVVSLYLLAGMFLIAALGGIIGVNMQTGSGRR